MSFGEIVEFYDKLSKEFFTKYGKYPNVAYMHEDEYNYCSNMFYSAWRRRPSTICGMEIKIIESSEERRVGYVSAFDLC